MAWLLGDLRAIIAFMPSVYSPVRKKLAGLLLFLFGFLFSHISLSFAAPVQTYDELLASIRVVQQENANPIQSDLKQAGLRAAWGIGRLINEHIALNQNDDEFRRKLLERLAKDLESSPQDLQHKTEFAQVYPEVPKTINLTWSHYMEIVQIHDPAERAEITRQAEVGKWPVKKLREEINEHRFKTIETEKAVIAAKLPELKPGKPGFYKIVNMNGELVAELGFDIYRDAPHQGLVELEENQIISGTGKYFIADPDAKHEDLYSYYADVMDVEDGDTIHAAIYLGFGTTLNKRLKLRRVDAPELKKDFGEQARAALINILSRSRGKIIIRIARGNDQDQYGRYLVDVFVNGKNIDQELADTTLFTTRS